jgi:hypothetical protein
MNYCECYFECNPINKDIDVCFKCGRYLKYLSIEEEVK